MSLKELRFQKNITQWRLALLSGVSQSRIPLIENELSPAKDGEKQRIARGLGVRVEEIFPVETK